MYTAYFFLLSHDNSLKEPRAPADPHSPPSCPTQEGPSPWDSLPLHCSPHKPKEQKPFISVKETLFNPFCFAGFSRLTFSLLQTCARGCGHLNSGSYLWTYHRHTRKHTVAVGTEWSQMPGGCLCVRGSALAHTHTRWKRSLTAKIHYYPQFTQKYL